MFGSDAMGSSIVARPERAYLVCATPRSGSTLLCEVLQGTGVAGRPGEPFEALAASGRPRQPRGYFDGVTDPTILALLPEREPGAPITRAAARARLAGALRDGTTPNGVFGAKLMWSYFGDFLAGLRDVVAPGTPEPELLTALFGDDLRYVQVVRRDKVGQAVSLWRAIQTQAWRDEGASGPPPEAVYHGGAIAHLATSLAAHEDAWTAWFARHGIEPALIAYEELDRAVEPAVRELLRWLGLDPGDGWHFEPPRLRRQADDRSRRWAERFAAERDRGPGAVA
jgi:trehalose 2-sulfotransferase